MMYKTAVPLMLSNPRFEEYYDELVRRCKKAGIQRTFLCVSMAVAAEEIKARELALVKKYLPKLQAEGFEVGVWFSSLGHGGTCEIADTDVVQDTITRMQSLEGHTNSDSYCPLDEEFQRISCDWAMRLAAAGAEILMLDDDFRMSFRGGETYCCCEKHRALLEAELGEPFDAERMRKALREGGPNSWRDAWLKVQREGLHTFAARLRAAVDTVNSQTRLTHCAVLSTWDADGSSLELSRTFAGSTRPLLRLIGAPYWAAIRAFGEVHLGTVCEYERMQQQWCANSGVEIFCEGDVYPRPRYTTSAAYLEGFDQVMQAAGTSDGILKYMFDYTSSPTYETGYYDRHLRDLALFRRIGQAFGGKRACGITVFEPMQTLQHATDPGAVENRCLPASLRFVTDNSLPVRYDAGEDATVIFGDAAELAGEEQLKQGAVLDLAAARILTRRGFDVGLKAVGDSFAPTTEYFAEDNETVGIIGGHFYKLELNETADILSFLAQDESENFPGSYCYQNAAGQRFLVYAFTACNSYETGASHGVFRGWCRAAQLRRQLPWLAGRTPDALCDAAPDLYMLVKRDARSLTVGLWNFGADAVLNPRVQLGETWAGLIAVEGKSLLNGTTVTLNEIPSFGFAAFTLTQEPQPAARPKKLHVEGEKPRFTLNGLPLKAFWRKK